MAPHIYDALPPTGTVHLATRLVMLAPGFGDQEIVCSLIPIDLKNNNIQYEALSYVWGTGMATSPVRCGDGFISITSNLEVALKGLRLEKQSRLTWIEAICINQDDLPGCTRQVGYITQVYYGAARTLVWLGPQSDIQRVAFQRAEELYNYRSELLGFDNGTSRMDMPQLDSNPAVDQAVREAMLDDSKRDSSLALVQMFGSHYFQRVWCIQEVVASSNAIAKSGDLEMDFFTFFHLSTMS